MDQLDSTTITDSLVNKVSATEGRVTALDSTSDTNSLKNKVGAIEVAPAITGWSALQTWKTSAQGDIDSKASKTTTEGHNTEIENLKK